MMATHEFVVPRSIPITSPTSVDLYRRAREEASASGEVVAVAAAKKGFTAADLRAMVAADRRNNVEDNIFFVC